MWIPPRVISQYTCAWGASTVETVDIAHIELSFCQSVFGRKQMAWSNAWLKRIYCSNNLQRCSQGKGSKEWWIANREQKPLPATVFTRREVKNNGCFSAAVVFAETYNWGQTEVNAGRTRKINAESCCFWLPSTSVSFQQKQIGSQRVRKPGDQVWWKSDSWVIVR